MDIEKYKDKVLEWFKQWFNQNYLSGTPRIPPHTHNGVDNLPIPSTSITGNFDASRINNLPAGTATKPGGVSGDIQINAAGAFGTIGGLNLDQTGNARGASALDIQSIRSAVTKVASGSHAVAIGSNNTASGSYSTAAGEYNTASGNYTTVLGFDNTASAKYSTVVGNFNTTAAGYTTIIGDSNIDSSTSSSADNTMVGNNNKITNSGAYSCILVGNTNTISAGVTGGAIGSNISHGVSGLMRITMGGSSTVLDIGPSGNLGINGTSYGSGLGVIFIKNAGTTPTTNPVAGGVLYSTGGALHWLGSSGTDTPIAPA